MTGRARLWLALVAVLLAMVVVVSRSQAMALSADLAERRAAHTRALGLNLRAGQEQLATALLDAGRERFSEADRSLVLAGTLLSRAREQLLALGRSSESGHVLALMEGIEVARGLIVRVSVLQVESEQVAFAGRQR